MFFKVGLHDDLFSDNGNDAVHGHAAALGPCDRRQDGEHDHARNFFEGPIHFLPKGSFLKQGAKIQKKEDLCLLLNV
jgi:hypothetical protein